VKSTRGFPYGLPVGSGLLLLGVGLFLVVVGLLVPSFVLYWNREPANVRSSFGKMSGSLGPGKPVVIPVIGSFHLGGARLPISYSVTVKASGAIHAELISFDENIPSEDWGIGTYFSRILTVTEEVHIRVSNPSSSQWIDYEASTEEVFVAGYPSEYISTDLPYIAALVVVGVVSLGIGAVLLKRDAVVFLGSVHEKGFWICFLLPFMLAMDAVTTYLCIQPYRLALETNPIIVSLYRTGLWAVVIFHFAAILLVFGFSFLLYRFMVKSGLPRISKIAIAVLFSMVSAIIGEVALASLASLLSLSFVVASQLISALFVFVLLVPMLFSCVLSAYLSTVILQSEERSRS